MDDVVIAHTVRNERMDCLHYGSIVVVNSLGDVLFSVGNAEKYVYERSITKPFKAVQVVESGAAHKYNFGNIELALIAGSHSGTRKHIEKLEEMLATLDIDISDLKCGAEIPLGTDAVEELICGDNAEITALHCDCSGEHIGNIALCLHYGWSIENYEHQEHPVQTELQKVVNEFLEFSTCEFAIDDCSLPTYYVPLVSLAKGMANLSAYRLYSDSSKSVVQAMIEEPGYFAGENSRFITNLVRSSHGQIVGKCGAEGLFALGWPDQGIGLAVKVADGNHRGAIPAIASVIERLNLVDKETIQNIQHKTAQDIYTNSGEKVGWVVSNI